MDETMDFSVASFGSRGKSCIGQEDGDFPPLRESNEIRPDFGLDEHKGAGIDFSQDRPSDPGQIDRIVDHTEGFGNLFRNDPVAGRGRGAEDDMAAGCGGAEVLYQLQRKKDLTDADSVDPERLLP